MGNLTCLDSISLTFSCALIPGVKTLEEKHYSKEVHSSPHSISDPSFCLALSFPLLFIMMFLSCNPRLRLISHECAAAVLFEFSVTRILKKKALIF